jgi:hypothetical protein
VAADPVRDEAEQLVAAAIAAVSMAARGLSAATGDHLATGSAECRICPICRVIAAVREPDPDLTERLATSAGELAAGVAAMLRSFAQASRPPDEEPARGDEADARWESVRAKAEQRYRDGAAPTVVKRVAKKAVKKAAPVPKAAQP